MQVVININPSLIRRFIAASLLILAIAAWLIPGSFRTVESQAGVLPGDQPIVKNIFKNGEVADALPVNQNFAALDQATRSLQTSVAKLELTVADLEKRVGALEGKPPILDPDDLDLIKKFIKPFFDHIRIARVPLDPVVQDPPIDETVLTFIFEGVNIQILNGLGETGTFNGSGNLILGYQEPLPDANKRGGSHNLILGMENNYTSFGGIVGGIGNSAAGPFSSVLGGQANQAIGQGSVVTGGSGNTSAGLNSSLVGGAKFGIGAENGWGGNPELQAQ
ncbi:MAG: hypothetical protein HY717_18855 [Planctomycetes bacterium]|nr:hypothetical protein [Planctomycetota bacterium]